MGPQGTEVSKEFNACLHVKRCKQCIDVRDMRANNSLTLGMYEQTLH